MNYYLGYKCQMLQAPAFFFCGNCIIDCVFVWYCNLLTNIELYPESNENLPKLNPKKSPIESSSISLRNLSDDKFRVVHYMQDALGIPDNEFTKQVAKNQSFSVSDMCS